MFSTKESIKYGWSKFKENINISILTTLLLLGAGSLSMDDRGMQSFLFNLALSALLLVLRMGYTKIYLKINSGESVKFSDIFQEYNNFFPYLWVTILTFLATVGGLILLIVPGVLWGVRFSLAPIIVVDKKIGPVMAMKESYAMTKGIFWKLFGFWIVIGLINLGGMLALFIGLLVTVPLSTLATTHVYRSLSPKVALLNTEPATV